MIDVLVVEDDRSLLKLMTVALALDPELAVEGCLSGELALARIRDRAPSIVLVDLDLPGLGGCELAARIVSLAPDTKIVFVTGSTRADLEHPVLRKPFDPVTLAADVRRLAEGGARRGP